VCRSHSLWRRTYHETAFRRCASSVWVGDTSTRAIEPNFTTPAFASAFHPNQAVAAACDAFQLRKQCPMNKNYIPAYVCCSILPLRARHLLPFASCVTRRLFRSWRFYLSCVIGALLLSATNSLGGIITVTNGNDRRHDPTHCINAGV
jgi:hypothetical protein